MEIIVLVSILLSLSLSLFLFEILHLLHVVYLCIPSLYICNNVCICKKQQPLSIIGTRCLLLPDRFHRFHLINFTGRIYSGNGKLLQGDIYRGGADGRAAWREIKSDCLGKSEPSTRAIGTAATLRARPAGTPSFLPPSRRTAYQSRNEEHEEHTYRDISGPSSSTPRERVYRSLLFSRVRFNPFDGLYERDGMALPRSLTPESISRTAIKHRDVSSVARDRARLINFCRTRPESSCPHFVARLHETRCRELFILRLPRNAHNFRRRRIYMNEDI